MPLPLFIIIVLSFCGVLFGAWYYYRCTPEGRVKDAEANLTDYQRVAKAAHTMVSIDEAESEINTTLNVIKNRHSKNLNPLKILDEEQVHPECADVPEVCPACHKHLLIDRCVNRACSLYED